jgi:hypothetical protein
MYFVGKNISKFSSKTDVMRIAARIKDSCGSVTLVRGEEIPIDPDIFEKVKKEREAQEQETEKIIAKAQKDNRKKQYERLKKEFEPKE